MIGNATLGASDLARAAAFHDRQLTAIGTMDGDRLCFFSVG
jgi:hypothetical protein